MIINLTDKKLGAVIEVLTLFYKQIVADTNIDIYLHDANAEKLTKEDLSMPGYHWWTCSPGTNSDSSIATYLISAEIVIPHTTKKFEIMWATIDSSWLDGKRSQKPSVQFNLRNWYSNLTGNGRYMVTDLEILVDDNDERVNDICLLLYTYFSLRMVPSNNIPPPPEFIKKLLTDTLMELSCQRQIQQHKNEIASCEAMLREYQENLIAQAEQLTSLLRIKITPENESDLILKSIQECSKIRGCTTSILPFKAQSGYLELAVKIQLPISECTINFRKGVSLPFSLLTLIVTHDKVTISSSFNSKPIRNPHPHLMDTTPCMGGFTPLITKALIEKNYPIILSTILAWKNTYQPHNSFYSLGTTMLGLGIVIEESEYNKYFTIIKEEENDEE